LFWFAPILGHVGDGNFHLGICAKDGDADEFEKADALHHRLVERALAMDGTCTGEHGIGRGKMQYLEQELGCAVSLMRNIKLALDPDNIMNPGRAGLLGFCVLSCILHNMQVLYKLPAEGRVAIDQEHQAQRVEAFFQ